MAIRHKINFPLDSQPDLDGSAIGRLAQSLYPLSPCGRIFLVLTAYYDESGTHGGSPATVLAGFVGDSNDWVDFDIEWSKVLKKHGITHLRAKHLFHCQGEHKGWSDEQVRYLMNDVMYILQERKHIYVSKTVLYEEDYKMFYVMDGPAKKERLDTRYALCFRSFLNFLPAVAKNGGSTINFILEAGHKNMGDALRVFTEIKEDKNLHWRHNIGVMSFASKRDFGALQAADLLAYLSYQDACDEVAKKLNYFESIDAELAWDCGMTIIGNVISPDDMKNMRMNFLRKNKLPVFQRASHLNGLEWEVHPDSWYAQYAGLRPANHD